MVKQMRGDKNVEVAVRCIAAAEALLAGTDAPSPGVKEKSRSALELIESAHTRLLAGGLVVPRREMIGAPRPASIKSPPHVTPEDDGDVSETEPQSTASPSLKEQQAAWCHELRSPPSSPLIGMRKQQRAAQRRLQRAENTATEPPSPRTTTPGAIALGPIEQPKTLTPRALTSVSIAQAKGTRSRRTERRTSTYTMPQSPRQAGRLSPTRESPSQAPRRSPTRESPGRRTPPVPTPQFSIRGLRSSVLRTLSPKARSARRRSPFAIVSPRRRRQPRPKRTTSPARHPTAWAPDPEQAWPVEAANKTDGRPEVLQRYYDIVSAPGAVVDTMPTRTITESAKIRATNFCRF